MSNDGWPGWRTKRRVKVPRGLTNHPPWRGLNEMRDKLVEMEGRIGELGSKWPCSRPHPVYLSRFSAQSCVHRPLDEFIDSSFVVRTQTNSSITVSALGLYLSHIFLQRPPPTRISQPTIYPFLCHPCRTTTITSAIPNGDYRSPSGAVVVGQGTLSPPQSPPTTSNFGSASTASAGARAERSRPVSALCMIYSDDL